MYMEKVIVILSSYNGENYIEEQIESLLGQSYQNMEIYVRDDGSTDKTFEILKKYEKLKKIRLESGNNIGYINSFLTGLKNCGDADYYFYCDQDDVWYPDKIQRAVDTINERYDQNEKEKNAILYFSDYDYYDQRLQFQCHSSSFKKGPSFQNALVDFLSLGVTVSINKKARNEICRFKPINNIGGHDGWTYLVCSGIGYVIYDRGYYGVKYRRHNETVTETNMNFIEKMCWRYDKFIKNNKIKLMKKRLIEFEKYYGDQLSLEQKKILAPFIEENHKFKNIVKRVFSTRMYRQNYFEEIQLRLLILCGKF